MIILTEGALVTWVHSDELRFTIFPFLKFKLIKNKCLIVLLQNMKTP